MDLREKKLALLAELEKEGVLNKEEIREAFEKVDRKNFVPKEYQENAYINEPIAISFGQTVSQPYTVAFMLDALDLKKGQKVLDVGTGSGWAAALLAKIVGSKGKVITIERVEELYEFAKQRLKKYKNVKQVLGDGSKGYEKEAPYDRITVAAASPDVPKPLFDQLKESGILLIPIGGDLCKTKDIKPMGNSRFLYSTSYKQKMLKIKKVKGKMKINNLGEFVFVPLIGKCGFENESIN